MTSSAFAFLLVVLLLVGRCKSPRESTSNGHKRVFYSSSPGRRCVFPASPAPEDQAIIAPLPSSHFLPCFLLRLPILSQFPFRRFDRRDKSGSKTRSKPADEA